MTRDEPTTRVQWQYYRIIFGGWGDEVPEGWWAAESEQDAKACAEKYGDGTYRSRVMHLTYDEWEEKSAR